MDSICGFQSLNAVLSSFLSTKIRHLFNYCCHGNQLDIMWFRLNKSTNEAYYMYQISCQSDELR